MPRYIKQYDSFSCGPIAILNALKWAGMRVTRKSHIRRLVKECKSKLGKSPKDWGTYSADLDKTLRKYGEKLFEVRKVRKCGIKELHKQLADNGAIIIAHLDEGQREPEGHFSFWFKVDTDGLLFTGVNDGGGKAVTTQTREQLIDKIRKRNIDGDCYPDVWFLTKHE